MKYNYLIFMIVLLTSSHSWAVLGAKNDSVEADRKAFEAARGASVQKGNFTVDTLSSGGLTLREYSSSDGTIFGIAWNGINHPDLTTLLGDYFSDYQKSQKATTKARGRQARSVIQGSNLVVEKSGHMHAARGKAYIPSLFPEGVSASDIQ